MSSHLPPSDPDAASAGPLGGRQGRPLRVGAAQLGPIGRHESREQVVDRLIALMEQAAGAGVELVVYPELALTTFFPRWFVEDEPDLDLDSFYEREMPGPETKRLFDLAAEHGIGFSLGYAELTPDGHRHNTTILVERDGSIVGHYRKVHLPLGNLKVELYEPRGLVRGAGPSPNPAEPPLPFPAPAPASKK